MVLIRCFAYEYTLFPGCVVAAGGDSPVYPFVVHTELSRFLNCRTIVTSVELSFVMLYYLSGVPKCTRVELVLAIVGCIYIYFDPVITISKESTSPVVLSS